jgi:hypothetical protein
MHENLNADTCFWLAREIFNRCTVCAIPWGPMPLDPYPTLNARHEMVFVAWGNLFWSALEYEKGYHNAAVGLRTTITEKRLNIIHPSRTLFRSVRTYSAG